MVWIRWCFRKISKATRNSPAPMLFFLTNRFKNDFLITSLTLPAFSLSSGIYYFWFKWTVFSFSSWIYSIWFNSIRFEEYYCHPLDHWRLQFYMLRSLPLSVVGCTTSIWMNILLKCTYLFQCIPIFILNSCYLETRCHYFL